MDGRSGSSRLSKWQADLVGAAPAVKLLIIQPLGSNFNIFHPYCEVQDWDFETKLWVTRWTIVLGLDVLDDGVRNLLHLLHGDLIVILTTLIKDFINS